MKELASAAAWLESLGLTHGDIKPANLLLDADNHLKLADFDNTNAVGTEVEVGTPPYARSLGDEAGTLRGTFGFLGPRTEQFAIGSVFCYIIRGYEPYNDQWYGKNHGPKTVAMLQRMELPDTDACDVKDRIIRECWDGKFRSVKDLANTASSLGSQSGDVVQELTQNFIEVRREECRQHMAGFPSLLPTQPSHRDSAVSNTKSTI